VSAKDLGTGREAKVKVQPTSGLSESQIENLQREADTKRDDDLAKRELAELRNRAETLIYTCKRSLEVYGSALSESDRTDIEADTERLESLLQSGGAIEDVREALASLESSSHQIYEAMLADAGQE
jgi:molecular chaperone DnaK